MSLFDKLGLSNRQQALMMMLGVLLGPVAAWAALGFPTDRIAIGFLVSMLIGAAVTAGFFGTKELAGGSTTPDPAVEAKKAQLQSQIDALQKQKDALG